MTKLAALALCCASAAAMPVPAAAQDEDSVAALARVCAETRCHQPGTIKVNMKDGSTAEFQAQYAWPIVHEGFVALYPGVTVFLTGEIVDGKVVNLRAIDEPETPANVIKLQMRQDEGKPDTFLTVTNHFPQFIKYRAGKMLPDSNDIRSTSSCPVMSDGRIGYEHWPYPIFQLLLTDFHVVEMRDGELTCD